MILAVEVLSPSTRRKDPFYKRSKYEDAAVPSYWIVDPEEPSITALELVDGRYVTVGEATGDQPVTLEQAVPGDDCPGRPGPLTRPSARIRAWSSARRR